MVVNAHRTKIATVGAAALIVAAALAIAKGGHGDAAVPSSIHPSALAWVHPSALPTGWSVKRLPGSPARLPTPASWQSSEGDPGTRTTVLKGPSGEIAGYLNATPRQGVETPANWSAFRVDHNREEGDRKVRLLAAAAGLRFRTATGSCVLDSYTTANDHSYREVACIVAGQSATTVIVAAAPPRRWGAEAPTLERAITSFTT
jgi:hypothetical protein